MEEVIAQNNNTNFGNPQNLSSNFNFLFEPDSESLINFREFGETPVKLFNNVSKIVDCLHSFSKELNAHFLEKKMYYNNPEHRSTPFSNPNASLSRFLESNLTEDELEDHFFDNQRFYDLMSDEILISEPRFVQFEGLTTPQSGKDSASSGEMNKNSGIRINFQKMQKNLKTANGILQTYKRKVDKISQDIANFNSDAGSGTSSIPGSRDDDKLSKLYGQRHHTVDFAIFLSFKMFKLELLEFFLHLRDTTSSTVELCSCLGLKSVYYNVFSLIAYLQSCSDLMTITKKGFVRQQKSSPHLPQYQQVLQMYKPDSEMFEKSIQDKFYELSNSFEKRAESVDTHLSQVQEFIKALKNGNLSVQKPENPLFEYRIRKHFVSQLMGEASRFENLAVVILNYHVRYHRLISQFVEQNKDSQLFQHSLSPQFHGSVTSKSSVFGTLIVSIEKKISKNMGKIREFVAQMTQCLLESEKCNVTEELEKFGQCSQIVIQIMRTFKDSFDYLNSLIPLFPSETRTLLSLNKKSSRRITPNTISKGSRAIGISGDGKRRKLESRMRQVTPGNWNYLAYSQYLKQQNPRNRMRKRDMSQYHHVHSPHSLQHYKKGESFDSVISTSWFIINPIKLQFQEVIFKNLAVFVGFLKSLGSRKLEIFMHLRKFHVPENDELASLVKKRHKNESQKGKEVKDMESSNSSFGQFLRKQSRTDFINGTSKNTLSDSEVVEMFFVLRYEFETGYRHLVEKIRNEDNWQELVNYLAV